MTRVSDQIFYFVLFDGDMSQKPMISLILSLANGGLREIKVDSTNKTHQSNDIIRKSDPYQCHRFPSRDGEATTACCE